MRSGILGNAEVLRSPTPATKTCRWGPRSAQDDEYFDTALSTNRMA